MERRAAQLLWLCVVTSFACLAAGVALLLAGSGASAWLLNAGILVLMSAPFLRVLFSALEFAGARDWPFAAAATAVLAILLASMFYSRSA